MSGAVGQHPLCGLPARVDPPERAVGIPLTAAAAERYVLRHPPHARGRRATAGIVVPRYPGSFVLPFCTAFTPGVSRDRLRTALRGTRRVVPGTGVARRIVAVTAAGVPLAGIPLVAVTAEPVVGRGHRGGRGRGPVAGVGGGAPADRLRGRRRAGHPGRTSSVCRSARGRCHPVERCRPDERRAGGGSRTGRRVGRATRGDRTGGRSAEGGGRRQGRRRAGCATRRVRRPPGRPGSARRPSRGREPGHRPGGPCRRRCTARRPRRRSVHRRGADRPPGRRPAGPRRRAGRRVPRPGPPRSS